MIPPAPHKMKSDRCHQRNVKYQSRRCSFLCKQVWAILSQQPDGSWKIANCLDKQGPCFARDCAFVTDGGQWPFDIG